MARTRTTWKPGERVPGGGGRTAGTWPNGSGIPVKGRGWGGEASGNPAEPPPPTAIHQRERAALCRAARHARSDGADRATQPAPRHRCRQGVRRVGGLDLPLRGVGRSEGHSGPGGWQAERAAEPASAPLLDYLNSHASISGAPPSHAVGSKDAGGK